MTFWRHDVCATQALTVSSPSVDRRGTKVKHLAFMLLFLLGSLNVWGAEQSITLTFYDGSKISSTSGTNASLTYVRGITTFSDNTLDADDVVTDYSATGTVQYGKNGGLTLGANSTAAANFTITFDDSYEFYRIDIVGAKYEANSFTINGDAGTGELNDKGTELANCTKSLVFEKEEGDEYSGALTFAKTATKRGTIYTITLYYDDGEGGGAPEPTVSADPTSLDFEVVGKDDVVAVKTFTLTGSDLTDAHAVTVAAPSGYKVSVGANTPAASISISPSDGAISSTIKVTPVTSTVGTFNGNITISSDDLDDDVEVALAMEVKAKYTVTWNNNGVTSTSQVLDGAKPVFPATPAACDATSTTFIGWATAAWDGKLANLDDKTVYTSAAAMPAVTGAVTYYAVFAKSSGSSAFDGEHGGTFRIYAQVGDDKVYAGSYSSSKYGGTDDADDATDFEIAAVDDAFTIKDGAKYLTYNSSTNFGKSDDPYYWNIEAASTAGSWHITSVNTSTRGFIYRASTYNVFGAYSSGNVNGTEYYDVEISGATSYGDYMTTCCTKRAITIASGIENGTVSADPTSACEGATVTITFSPAGGYHLDSWSVNSVAQDVNDNTFTMPDEAVTVSATFVHDDCSNLLAPTLDEITKTYNSATIAWNEVTDAEEYAVSVVNHATSESVFAGNVDALSKALADLEPETQYDYIVMAVGDGTVKCADGNGLLEGDFTTDALPTAHLTLKDPSGTHASSGDYAILTPFNLPTTAAACSKTFVGWDANPDCATAPTYAKGASFTFDDETDATLYAVYADGGPTNGTITKTMSEIVSENNYTVSSGTNATMYKVLALNSDITLSTTGDDNCGSFWGTSPNNEWRLYQNKSGNAIVTAASGCTLTSVKFTFSVSNTGALLNGSDAMTSETAVSASGSSATYTVGNSSTATNGQIRITAVEVKYTKAGSYSNYSTTCAAAPEVIVAPEEINATAAAVAAGVIEAAYDNVDEELISVALYNDEACTEDFDGGWLTASINGDNNIAYTIAENTSYNNARTAYIKLTAPAAVTGPAAAEVVIPVSQAKKAAVFSSLEELVAADVNANTNVTVSFSNVVIKEIYMYNSNRRGLVFDIQKDAADIKIYFNADVPAAWTAGGKVSGTLTNCPWKIYSSAWQLAPASGWAWDNGDLTYTAPPAIASIEIREDATYKTYIDGQVFNPAGLKVIAIYDNSDEEDVTAYATWTFDPEKLSVGDDEVEVTAEYSDKSDSETITGLTVNPIPEKTVAQFIAAEGTRCYLEGIVSNITSTKYGNFDLTDASGTIYVYGCLNQAGESQKFADLGVSAGDKIKVIAEQYLNHATAGYEAVNVQFVSKVSPVQITIADQTLEEGANWTIVATTDPEGALANISYSIKDDGVSSTYVSLAGNVITANAIGTATIVASIPDGEGYLANEIEFEVEVVEAGSVVPVVILAQYDGQWYALMNEYYGSTTNSLNALAVDYNEADGVLLDLTSAQQSAITWTRSIAAGKATFLNGTKYIAGGTSNTNLTLSESASEWTIDGAGHYMKGTRTFLYNDGGFFKNFAENNAGDAHYSSYPVVLANPQFMTRVNVRENLVEGKMGTICPAQEVKYPTGASFYTLTYKEVQAGMPYKVFFDEIAEGASLAAGKPYLFIADGEDIKGIKVGDVTTTVHAYNGFIGVLEEENTHLNVSAQDESDHKYYIVYENQIRLCGAGWFNVPVERAYLDMSQMPEEPVAQAPGRRRVCLANPAANAPTDIDAINASEKPMKLMIDGQLYILRGEKMFDATGRLVK